MKKIYIVLTFTGTMLSRVVHIYTKQEFYHSSLSLDKDLNEMYSFGRYWAYNPFIGGFVKEEIDSGTFKRFYKLIEIDLPQDYKKYTFAGFITTTSKKLLGENHV